MLLSSYIAYFETLATRHHSIRHQPNVAGSTDVAIGSRRFATYNVDDVILKQLRTSVGFPALLLEVYEWDMKGEDVYSLKNEYKGAFSIVDHANNRDYEDEKRALIDTEIILRDILKQLFADHYGAGIGHCSTPFTRLDLAPSNATAIGPVFENEFGWRFEFSFRPKDDFNLTEAPAPGIFI